MNGSAGALSASAMPSNKVQECDLSPIYSLRESVIEPEIVAKNISPTVCTVCRLSILSACSIRCCNPIHCANSTASTNNAVKQSLAAVGVRDENAGFKKYSFVYACECECQVKGYRST